MAPGWAARLAAVCTVLATVAPARADERRKVAVIDLSADPASKSLRDALYGALIDHWALRPLDTEGLNAALQGDFIDEDREGLAAAQAARANAEDALTRFDFQAAAADARDGERVLVSISPSAAAAACGDLSFDVGIAELELRQANDASLAFAFAHRLDPARKPDPVRYSPDILQAYATAAATRGAQVKLDVRGTGRVWVDGVERGAGPAVIEVSTGLHLVQLAAPDRVTTGQIVTVEHDQTLELATSPASEELQVARARKMLAHLPDDAIARAGAMNQLADLLHVHDAVLIWKRPADGALLVQTWRDRAPGFSALREHEREPASDVLEPLAPPKPPEVPRIATIPFTPPAHHEDEPAWYDRNWVRATAAGGVIVTVVGAILWARRSHMVTVDNNPQFITVPP
jgi:hypothetical protein